MTKKILLNLDYSEQIVDELKQIAPEYDWCLDLESVDWKQLEIIIGWHEDLANLLEDGDHQVKWLQLQSAGADYVPLKQLADQGITLTTSSGMHAQGISESILGMMLGQARKLFQSLKDQDNHYWANDELNLTTLEGKTLTIVGIGQIGQQTAKLAQAFGMETIGVNRSGNKPPYVSQVYTQGQVVDAVSQADYVVNILPLTDETKDFYDYQLFKKFKKGSMFINVGRGESVVTDDLMMALDSGHIAFAALDVFETEPLPDNHPLWETSQVLITPHSAGMMDDYLNTLLPIIKKNLTAYINDNHPAVNIVDYDKQY